MQGNKILDAGSNLAVPNDAQVIDLGDATLSPGFMDAHTHLAMDLYSDSFNTLLLQSLRKTIRNLPSKRSRTPALRSRPASPPCAMLGASSFGFVDVALRKAIAAGTIEGPRMLCATNGIGATGGHFDGSAGFRDNFSSTIPITPRGSPTVPEEIRKAVRYDVKNGADVIKAAVSGGVLSLTDEVDVPQFAPDEIKALVEEAHRLRKKVAVHCHGDQAARDAINAGVDSIEHGSFLKPETLTLMKQKGTYLTPTLLASDWIMGKIGQYPQVLQDKARAATDARSEMFRNALRIGVRISLGTDAGVFPHGKNAREFQLMTGLGMKPIERSHRRHLRRRGPLRRRRQTRHPGERQARRHHRDAGRPDRGHHRDRARLLRHEGRQDRQERQ